MFPHRRFRVGRRPGWSGDGTKGHAAFITSLSLSGGFDFHSGVVGGGLGNRQSSHPMIKGFLPSDDTMMRMAPPPRETPMCSMGILHIL
jgi:hypothetical protein